MHGGGYEALGLGPGAGERMGARPIGIEGHPHHRVAEGLVGGVGDGSGGEKDGEGREPWRVSVHGGFTSRRGAGRVRRVILNRIPNPRSAAGVASLPAARPP
jgi:hypothetical protein